MMDLALNEKLAALQMQRKTASRPDAKWRDIGDVDWGDLEHFLEVARRLKNAESFDTALRVLEALRKQVLER